MASAQAWFFMRQGQQQGPVGGQGMAELAMQGVVDESTEVWTDGMPDWAALGETELAELLPPATKRQRVAGPGAGTDQEVLREVPAWIAALDEPATVALFEQALFHHLEDAIRGRTQLRNDLLTAYVQRHPASDEQDPSAYKFTDKFLLEVVEDFQGQEEMWKVLGAAGGTGTASSKSSVGSSNVGSAVCELIAAAAALDRRYCAQLQGLALLCRARRLLAPAGPAAGEQQAQAVQAEQAEQAAGQMVRQGQQLLALLKEEDTLAIARDLNGRSLWHDLVERQRPDLLRLLLPEAVGAAPAAAGAATDAAATASGGDDSRGGGGDEGQEGGQGQERSAGQRGRSAAQRQPNPLNLPDNQGCTPLHLAAQSGQLAVARLLAEAGANLDLQNRDPSKYAAGDWSVQTRGLDYAIPVPTLHQTPLHIAAEAGDLDMMRLLVGRGALLNVRDTAGSTPLHLALEVQDEEAVALLLQAGANPTLSSHDIGEDSSPLHAAAAAGSPGILRALLDAWPAAALAAAVNQPGDNGWTPLMLAARRGSSDCVRLLLERGADASTRTRQGKTAADIAAVNKREAVAALLLERA